MDFYKSNMQWLERSQKDIFDFLMNEDKDIISDSGKENFIVFEARDGEKGLSIKRDEKIYRLNSAYSPREEARIWAKQYKSENLEQIIFMYGLGNGVFANELYRTLKLDGKLCIYEPDLESFQFVLANFNLVELLSSDRVRFIVKGINEQHFYNLAISTIDYYNLKNIIICDYPQYVSLYDEEYQYFNNKLKTAVTTVITNRNTAGYFGKRKVKNIIYNLSYIDSAITLADLVKARDWKKDTAIIVAAGPSLDKNIRELKKAKGKAVIIATDTAIRFLANENIKPDFIITVDAEKPVEYFSKYPQFFDIPLFCRESSNYEIMKVHTGRKIWFLSYDYLKNIYDRYDKEISFNGAGGSVATAAFSICVELGIKQIILVGQDLAYAGNRTHAGELKDDIMNKEFTSISVEGVDGKLIRTRMDWESYKIWFEEAMILKPEMNVIDATEGGAKIKGTRIETLKEAIVNNCIEEIDCATLIKEIPVSLTEKQLRDTYIYIKRQLEDFSVIKKEIKEVIEICNIVLSLMVKKPYANVENYSKKIIKKNTNIIQYDIIKLVIVYTCENTNKKLNSICQMTDNETENIRKTYEITKLTFQSMLEGIEPVRKLLKTAVEKFPKIQ